MPTVFAANESSVMVDGELIEGVRSIDYRHHQTRESIYALGSAERIGMTSGPQIVEGRLRLASTSPSLDQLEAEQQFQISAQLRHGDTQMSVTFDECYLMEKSYDMGVGGHGETVYTFTATRVREELG